MQVSLQPLRGNDRQRCYGLFQVPCIIISCICTSLLYLLLRSFSSQSVHFCSLSASLTFFLRFFASSFFQSFVHLRGGGRIFLRASVVDKIAPVTCVSSHFDVVVSQQISRCAHPTLEKKTLVFRSNFCDVSCDFDLHFNRFGDISLCLILCQLRCRTACLFY